MICTFCLSFLIWNGNQHSRFDVLCGMTSHEPKIQCMNSLKTEKSLALNTGLGVLDLGNPVLWMVHNTNTHELVNIHHE